MRIEKPLEVEIINKMMSNILLCSKMEIVSYKIGTELGSSLFTATVYSFNMICDEKFLD